MNVVKNNLFNAFDKLNLEYNEKYFSFDKCDAKFNFFNTNNLNLSEEEIKKLSNASKIFVFNSHTQNILKKINIPSELIKIPFDYIDKPRSPLLLSGISEYNFLSVIDTVNSSNWKIIVESYCKTFTQNDNTSLILKITNGDYQIFSQQQLVKEIYNIKLKYNNASNIIFLGSEMNDDDLMRLYKTSQCYINIDGDSLGYSFLRAYMSGLYCVGADKSSNLDILNLIQADLIKPKSIVKKNNGLTHYNYDVDYVCKMMKVAYSERLELKEKKVKRRKLILNGFMSHNVALDFFSKVN